MKTALDYPVCSGYGADWLQTIADLHEELGKTKGEEGVAGMREHTIYSDWSRGTMVNSKIVKDLKVAGPEYFHCPRCWAKRGSLIHGKEGACSKCGLRFIRYGNSLEIWDTEALWGTDTNA